MLKIKDNIDLKELEKFGFENNMRDLKDDEWSYVELLEDGTFYTTYNDDEYYSPTKEYEIDDLIKADLVEKVD